MNPYRTSGTPVIQSVLSLRDDAHGFRYLKLTKSQVGPHFVLDIMFVKGLRLTVDLFPGKNTNEINPELTLKLMSYRACDYSSIKPYIDFVSECVTFALSDGDGKISEQQLHSNSLNEAWSMALFKKLLITTDPERLIDYELANQILTNFMA